MKISLKRFLIFTFLLVLLSLTAGYIYLKVYSWRNFASPKEMEFNGEILNSQPSLPTNFYKAYDKIYPGYRKYNMNDQLVSEIFSGLTNKRKIHECRCDDIGYLAWNNHNFNFKFEVTKLRGNYRQFGYGIEEYSSPQKCFDFWINHDIFLHGRYLENLDELSNLIHKKTIKELSNEEMIKLIAYRELGNRAFSDTVQLSIKIKNLIERYNK